MGLLGWLIGFVVKRALLLAVLAAVVLLVPGLPPYTTFSEIELAPTMPREGVLAPNNALDGVKHQLESKLHGPEAFQVHAGELYTSIGSGEIVKLSPAGHLTFVTKIGQPCEGLWQEDKCGRPLGFRIDDAGKYIYVVDTYYGIWRVELASDRKQLLVPPGVPIAGRAPRMFNSVALAANGDFYWTDSSSDFQLRDGAYTSLVDPSGRLFHYDAAKNESRVLLDGLWFSNGVALSPNEEFAIVAESLSSAIHRVYLKGPKKGQRDIFVDGLPGITDNIQPLTDGSGVLVSLYKVFDEEHPMIGRSLARFPLLRKLAARLQRLVEMPFEFLQRHYPHYVFEKVVHTIGHFSSMGALLPKASGLVQLDWNGKVVGAWFNQDGSAGSISDAIVYNDLLYLGSPHNPFVGTLPAPEQLKRAFTKQKTSPPPKAPETVKKQAEQVKASPPPKAPEPTKKPAEQPKPKAAEPTKAIPPQKPKVEKPAEPTKPTQPPKPTVQQPQAAKEAPRAATPKPAKVDPKPTQPPKVETKKPAETPKQTPPKAKKEQIPIVEDISSDTVKPSKEPLKVIKREGPAEIPHPEL